MAPEVKISLATGTRNGVKFPTQNRYCKREAVPKRGKSCVDASHPLWGDPGEGRKRTQEA